MWDIVSEVFTGIMDGLSGFISDYFGVNPKSKNIFVRVIHYVIQAFVIILLMGIVFGLILLVKVIIDAIKTSL